MLRNFCTKRWSFFATFEIENSCLSLNFTGLSSVAIWHFACSVQLAMNNIKTWWQVLPTGKKAWIGAGAIAFALVGLLAWNAFRTPHNGDSFAFRDQEDKIREMEDRVAKLQSELEDSAKQIARLQERSGDTPRAVRSDERRVNNSRREATRIANQIPSSETRFYETVRSTVVFEEPSGSSRKVATIPNGSKVRVVGSTGDWLEVRSKQGRPPGFIRRDDAVIMR